MRFGVLDGWRGVAALLVALDRLAVHGVLHGLPLLTHSYLFVDFFFVLSGFVVTHAYLDRLKDGNSTVAFAIRRFGRLWPLHAALLALFVAFEAVRWWLAARGTALEAAPFTGGNAPSTILPNLMFLQGLGLYDHLTWNQPSWSISTEFWTYLVFALVCLTARSRLTIVSGVIVAVSLFLVGLLSPDAMNATNDYGLPRCLAGFFAGSLTYRLWRAMRARTEATVRRRAGMLEPALVLAAGAFVWFAGVTPASLAAPIVFAALVYVFAFEAGPVSRVMDTRPFHALGAWSYSIYMVAYFVALMFERALNTLARGTSLVRIDTVQGIEGARRGFVVELPFAGDLVVLAYATVVVVVSWLTYRTVEAPARRLFNRLADAYEARAGRARAKTQPAE